MKEKVEALVGDGLKEMDLFVSDVYESVEEGLKTLNVELDSSSIIDVEKITEASKRMNPLLDEAGLTSQIDVLDIHSKQKGEMDCE